MTLWGGRFQGGPGEVLWSYTTDPGDRRLLSDDIAGSIAHVTMLGRTGILDQGETERILDGLERIKTEALGGEFEFEEDDEDVHSAVERRLGELIGEVAGKLHTARSRNDQVALDLRLYLRRSGAERVEQLQRFASLLADLGEEHAETLVPAYTHLQQAQPGTLGHHLLAYAWMALRDADRFGDALKRIDVSPLGAGASSGTSLPIEPEETARVLAMGGVFDNSLDAVGSRDHVAEYVFCCTQAMVSLSRLAEELVLWAGSEFGWIHLADQVSTGSSALPQKRNPDIAELVRGRSARVAGDLMGIIGLQKGLPLSYNRDLQEDKGMVFEADDILAASLEALAEMLRNTRFDPPPATAETVSLDLAEALVARGVPFREAHRAVGGLILALEGRGRALPDATLDDLHTAHAAFQSSDLDLLDPAVSVSRRKSQGSAGPESVRRQVAEIRRLTSWRTA